MSRDKEKRNAVLLGLAIGGVLMVVMGSTFNPEMLIIGIPVLLFARYA